MAHRDILRRHAKSVANGGYCCKSRFAQVIKNSAGCRRVFGVKMWGDMSPRVKLTGDFGNAIEGIRISNHLPLLVFAKNSWRCNFRLLQHYRSIADMERISARNDLQRLTRRDLARQISSASSCLRRDRSVSLEGIGWPFAKPFEIVGGKVA